MVKKNLGTAIIDAYKEVKAAIKNEPEIDNWFEAVGADRNLVAAFTEAVVIEIQKAVNIGSFGVIKEGIQWGFDAVENMSDDEIKKSIVNTYEENMNKAIMKRMA